MVHDPWKLGNDSTGKVIPWLSNIKFHYNVQKSLIPDYLLSYSIQFSKPVFTVDPF
jgi:hypothetical protein